MLLYPSSSILKEEVQDMQCSPDFAEHVEFAHEVLMQRGAQLLLLS